MNTNKAPVVSSTTTTICIRQISRLISLSTIVDSKDFIELIVNILQHALNHFHSLEFNLVEFNQLPFLLRLQPLEIGI